jgi:uncharacterized protein YqgV (UPF0045/DUF77 family)
MQIEPIVVAEHVNVYVNEIFEYLRSEEVNYLPNPCYM